MVFALFLLIVTEQWTHSDVKQVAEHVLEQDVLLIVLITQKRIVVDFEEPSSEVFVNQKVVTEKLPAELSLFLVDLIFDGKYRVNGDVFHGWKHVLFNIDAFCRVSLI